MSSEERLHRIGLGRFIDDERSRELLQILEARAARIEADQAVWLSLRKKFDLLARHLPERREEIWNDTLREWEKHIEKNL